jgi:hypothetical protein
MERSEGVIGYSHNNSQTYIHLDGSKRRRIFLADTPPKVPYFIQATQFIDEQKYDGRQLKFVFRGFGKTLLKIGGLKPMSEFRVNLSTKGRAPVSMVTKSNRDGVVQFRTQVDPPQTIYRGTLKQVRKVR